jgi:hypothetical protein
MKIKYREPYWVKFEWDISEHHDNQYVTLYDKDENKTFNDLFLTENYTINVYFKIKKHYKKDNICMVFGKPGKNAGLAFNSETNNLTFEFWSEDKFYQNVFQTVSSNEIETGVYITIIRNKNEFIFYKNLEEDSRLSFDGNLTKDYKDSSLFLGCSNPNSEIIDNRYYGEMDINHFSIIEKSSEINHVIDLYYSELNTLPTKKYYDNILCYYDFKVINNLDIVYDESKNSNFLEKVPTEYIK